MSMTQDRAEIVALGALEWLIAEDLMDTFQSSTGADRDQIRAAAGDPVFLAAVMDFIMMSDDWVQGVCAQQRLSHEMFLAARAALPGGDIPNWT
ncbi:hypothetical protein JANAI62_11370 [Jannaschia pagri]|uniref:DUF3572 family protein n=1 Tax=Jannaschia pagri TaxID=2829797 RepID=A0ABQ4NJY4_9RHOB|nr:MULTISPECIES: DUF3572 domain-containing protein [unclassified Jannaschia]GIT90682.1 hypothetical protein JANAI61_11400 [Jannaschia sp. AI_61]GIT94514.1 hypothetical protein JANAI62_11370 [Jannaschia sp. AI_62]